MEGILSLSLEELVILAILAFLLLKPNEYASIGRWAGRMLNNLMRSDGWKGAQQMLNNLRNLPRQLMRESYQEESTQMREQVNKSPAQRPPAASPFVTPFPKPVNPESKSQAGPAEGASQNDTHE